MIISNLKRQRLEILDEETVSWDLSNSFHLRLLIHYIGDIHQPLHSSNRFTSEYPTGDEGGNDFEIKVRGYPEVTNLHELWDSVILEEAKDIDLPLSLTDWDYLGNVSVRLRQTYNDSLESVYT